MRLERFHVKDVVFLAIMAALLFLLSALALPLMSISLFGLRNMATAILYGFFGTLALMKVPKPGALSLLGFFNAVILLLMSPIMFVINALSAVLSELMALTIFKRYDSDRAIITAASLISPLTLPFTAIFTVIMNGMPLAEVLVGGPWMAVLTCLGTIALSILGALLGRKIGRELQRAGKL